MEKKSSQRIIGVLVIVAFAIILLPLLFGGNHKPAAQAPVAKNETPADQHPAQIVAAAASAAAANPADTANSVTNLPQPPVLSQTMKLEHAPVATQTPANVSASASAPASAPVADEDEDSVADNTMLKSADIVKHDETIAAKPVVEKVIAVTSKVAAKKAHNVKHVGSEWAVQLGAFKNKGNAQRLVNKLRAAGYKAFTQTVGSTLRVCVPASDKPAAKTLVAQLEHKTALQGIIVPYNPMEL